MCSQTTQDINILISTNHLNLKHAFHTFFSREFAKEKERVETRAGFMQLKEQQKLEKELNGSASLTSFMLDNKVDSIKVEKRLNSKKVD